MASASIATTTSTNVNSANPFDKNQLVGNGRFRINKKIGKGSFGFIYSATNLWTGDEVAVKIENRSTPYPQLRYESNVLRCLDGGVGIPRSYWFGQEGVHSVLVMELLGKNLEDLFDYCNRQFTLKTVLMLAEEMLNRVEYLHEQNFVHRDLKPENFVMGHAEERHKLYLIDFGLSKKYRDNRSYHMTYREGKKLTGTVRYCSINVHLGIEPSRRDDMESLAYVLIYFLRGFLPWQGITGMRLKQRCEKVQEIKLATPIAKLCQGIPPVFGQFVEYCRKLGFDEMPNYQMCRSVFRHLFQQQNFEYDFDYDWEQKANAETQHDSTSSATASASMMPPWLV